jgi:hypothetical protein
MILGFFGYPRAGKTLGMVIKACKDLKAGKRVVSNVPITDVLYGSKNEAIYKQDIVNELYTCRDTTVCIDEAAIVLDSRFFNKMPKELIIGFAQSQKRANNIYYTSQGWSHCVKRLRDLTNFAIRCTKFPFNDNPWWFTFKYLDPEYYLLRSPKKYEKEYLLRTERVMATKRIYASFNTYNEVTETYLTDAKEINGNNNKNYFNIQ